MCLHPPRSAGLCCLALLLILAPAATAHAAAPAAPASARPAGSLWGRSGAGPGDLALGWATYLGGSGDDQGMASAVDGQGNVYVTGSTSSHDFPTTPGAARPGYGGGGNDAFVASYTPSGRLRWATYLGRSGNDEGRGIAADGQGNVYVTGSTTSRNFPTTPGAVQPRYGGGDHDAFVASYDTLGRLRWATFLGGSCCENGYAIAADGRGTVYVTGLTGSTDFPVTPGAAQPHMAGVAGTSDAFLASYDADGRLGWATYLDGWHQYVPPAFLPDDAGHGIAVAGLGDIYLAGNTQSRRFPVTPGAVQSVFAGGAQAADTAFVARLIVPASRPTALNPASPPPPGTPGARYFPATQHTLAGPFLAFWNRLGGIRTLGLPLSEPFTLAGQRVEVTERAVPVLTGGQITLLPLGRLLSAARVFAPVAPVPNTATRLYFTSTGHTLSGPFLAYWQAHQGSALLGPPISEPEKEGTGDGTGRVYLVQWFTNGRLEYHPEIQDPRYRVAQGRVGYEYLHRAGLL